MPTKKDKLLNQSYKQTNGYASGYTSGRSPEWQDERQIEGQTGRQDEQQEEHPLLKVRETLARTALRLMDAIDEEVITAAPLNQRAAALGIVLERLLKVEQQLPAPPSEPQEYVYRVEYKDPDGSIHPTPHWTRTHLERDDAL